MNEHMYVLTEADSGNILSLEPGDQIEVVLEGNPAAGFQWQVRSRLSSSLEQVEPARSYAQYSPLAGSAGDFHFTFRAAEPGETTLKLAYRRPWEKRKKPLRDFSVTVVVMGNKEGSPAAELTAGEPSASEDF